MSTTQAPPIPAVDDAITAFTASRAALSHDQLDDANAQAALAAATAAAAATSAKVADDVTNYNASIDALVAALQAAKVSA
jgi:hypothetical protein